jgi:hypothetical protein
MKTAAEIEARLRWIADRFAPEVVVSFLDHGGVPRHLRDELHALANDIATLPLLMGQPPTTLSSSGSGTSPTCGVPYYYAPLGRTFTCGLPHPHKGVHGAWYGGAHRIEWVEPVYPSPTPNTVGVFDDQCPSLFANPTDGQHYRCLLRDHHEEDRHLTYTHRGIRITWQ